MRDHIDGNSAVIFSIFFYLLYSVKTTVNKKEGATSVLYIANAKKNDSGPYMCSLVTPTTQLTQIMIYVHVINGKFYKWGNDFRLLMFEPLPIIRTVNQRKTLNGNGRQFLLFFPRYPQSAEFRSRVHGFWCLGCRILYTYNTSACGQNTANFARKDLMTTKY